jgi:leucyl aminopeptidase
MKYIDLADCPLLIKVKTNDAIPLSSITTEKFNSWFDAQSSKTQNWITVNDFNAAAGSYLCLPDDEGGILEVFAGLGSEDEIEQPWHYSAVASTLPKATYYFKSSMSRADALMAAFSWAMASYKFDHYINKEQQKFAALVLPENTDADLLNDYIRAAFLPRDLVNTPTCDMGPTELSDAAEELSKAYDASFEVTIGDDLLKKGYRTIHAVGRAAANQGDCILALNS